MRTKNTYTTLWRDSMSEGRSVRLSKARKTKVDEERNAKRLADFMAKRKNNRKDTMSKLRAQRLRLNKMSPKSIGKK